LPDYSFRVKIDQIVTREIDIEVTARDEEQGRYKAREAAEVHPEPVEIVGIKRILPVSQTYWIPRDVEIMETPIA
jgi:hypothetical protein